MGGIYFDVTEIVRFAKNHGTVTGIQRVNLNVILLLACKQKSENLHCIFYNEKDRSYYGFCPAHEKLQGEPDAEYFLDILGWIDEIKKYPGRKIIKNYLKKYKHNKLVRSIKKIDIYVSSIFFPSRLAALGINKPLAGFNIKKIIEIPRDAVCVFLGADWHSSHIYSLARKHKENGGRIIQVIHDIIPVACPIYHQSLEKKYFEEWLELCFSCAADFVCISQYTASDLKRYSDQKGYSLNIKVVPLAHEFLGYGRTQTILQTDGLPDQLNRPYVLCVGTMEFRKNNVMLLQAWRKLQEEIPDQLPQLVFAGKPGSGYANILDFLSNNPELSPFVNIIRAPEDRDLVWMYQNCLFTVFVSHYEGWGLPVGESAWFGKYCVASSATSIPEVCGNLMDYVAPDNLDELVRVLKRAIGDDAYLADREEKIKEFSLREWRDVASDLYEIL